MSKPKIVLLSSKNRPEIRENILRGLFEPRIAELRKQADAIAKVIQESHEPDFQRLYRDKDIRPYLRYSTAHDFCWREVIKAKREGEPDGHAVRHLIIPRIDNQDGLQICFADLSYGKERATRVNVLAHSSEALTLSGRELSRVKDIIKAGAKLVEEFKQTYPVISQALYACKTVREFHERYPELAHLTLADETIEPPAPMPAPLHSDLVGKLVSFGLIAS